MDTKTGEIKWFAEDESLPQDYTEISEQERLALLKLREQKRPSALKVMRKKRNKFEADETRRKSNKMKRKRAKEKNRRKANASRRKGRKS